MSKNNGLFDHLLFSLNKRLVASMLMFWCSLPLTVMAVELPPLQSIDAYKVIFVSGEDVPEALDIRLEELSLAAIIDDEMEPIPYQIDEYNQGGALYFKNWNKVPIQGIEGVFDPQDKLLFVYKDAGSRKNSRHITDGEIIAEVELTGKDNIKRYVYLLRNSRLRSQEQYVRYSAARGHVETDFYSLTYDPKNHLKWLDFSARDFIGEPPLDSLKIQMKTGLITSLNQVTLNNDQFVAEPKGEKIGPIRATTQLETTLWLMQLPMLKISLQLHHYPKAILYDVRVLVPSVRRAMLVEPVFITSVEGNKLLGASIRTALGPKAGGIVDGVIDQNEQQMIANGIDVDNNWMWVSTKRNLDILSFFNFIGDTKEPIKVQLLDSLDAVDLPERFPGQLPNMGYKIMTFPENGFFGFVLSMYMSRGFEGDPERFTQDLRTMPEIKINTAL